MTAPQISSERYNYAFLMERLAAEATDSLFQAATSQEGLEYRRDALHKVVVFLFNETLHNSGNKKPFLDRSEADDSSSPYHIKLFSIGTEIFMDKHVPGGDDGCNGRAALLCDALNNLPRNDTYKTAMADAAYMLRMVRASYKLEHSEDEARRIIGIMFTEAREYYRFGDVGGYAESKET